MSTHIKDNHSPDVKIVNPETNLAKKLGGLKFNQIFDSKDIADAETVVRKSEGIFRVETAKDYLALQNFYKSTNLETLSKEDYEKLSAIAFSIKSRAETGGLPVASEVANSLYQFCDKAAQRLPKDGDRVLAIHYQAITEIMDGKFDSKDQIKAKKLVSGLTEISKKFSG